MEVCPKCKNRSVNDDNICVVCSEPEMVISHHTESSFSTDTDQDEYRTVFVGKRADYYLSRWRLVDRPTLFPSWNFGAFFFGMFWLIYRKMYFYACALFALGLVINVVEEFLGISKQASLVISLAFGIVLGIYANSLYLLHTDKKIQLLRSGLTKQDKLQLLQRLGGVNWLGVVLGIGAIVLILVVIISMELDNIPIY